MDWWEFQFHSLLLVVAEHRAEALQRLRERDVVEQQAARPWAVVAVRVVAEAVRLRLRNSNV